MIAAEPSSETVFFTRSSYGEVTPDTPSIFRNAVTVSLTGFSMSASVTFAPRGATTTSWADVPLTCGNVRLSVSSASWDSVPGMLKELSVP